MIRTDAIHTDSSQDIPSSYDEADLGVIIFGKQDGGKHSNLFVGTSPFELVTPDCGSYAIKFAVVESSATGHFDRWRDTSVQNDGVMILIDAGKNLDCAFSTVQFTNNGLVIGVEAATSQADVARAELFLGPNHYSQAFFLSMTSELGAATAHLDINAAVSIKETCPICVQRRGADETSDNFVLTLKQWETLLSLLG